MLAAEMASKGTRRRGTPRTSKPADNPGKSGRPEPVAPREIAAPLRLRGRVEVGIGSALLVGGIGLAISGDGDSLSAGRFLGVHGLGVLGAVGIAAGASRLDPRPASLATADRRRWIYGGLASLFAIVYALLMWKVIPNRLPSAMLHLATVPIFTLVMAIGTLVGGRFGWWLAITGGSLVLLSTIVLIARILASAAFLAGVYGAFGKAASTFALVSVALIVELVGILPICQVKFLMSRPGRRTYGV